MNRVNVDCNIVWISGMSGSGKSTLADYVKEKCQLEGLKVRIIDGDDVREKDHQKLGFGLRDVEKNNLRIARLCQESKNSGFNLVIVPVISPYREIRKKIRLLLNPNFHLIYLEADIETLERRDTKGLYRAAKKGLIKDLIGYSESTPYEIPTSPELVINTNNEDLIDQSRFILLNYVKNIMNK